MTQKFSVGDKVRILDASRISCAVAEGYVSGEVTEIIETPGGNLGIAAKGGGYPVAIFGAELDYIEIINEKPTQDKPTKKQRLSELERQVAELQAEVASLKEAKKPTIHIGKATIHITEEKSANEQRKAIIAEAKAFVKKNLAKNHRDAAEHGVWFVADACTVVTDKAEFIVNAKKRVVVALIKGVNSNEVYTKAIAKCAPDDVFNADIGKAIALGRALGLDVERFEQAVKPTKAVVGGTVFLRNIRYNMTVKPRNITEINSQIKRGDISILDDTNAEY